MIRGRHLILSAIAFAVVLAGSFAGWLGDRALAERAQRHALAAEAARLVERVELSIDHAITEMTELRILSIMDCDSDALAASRDMLLTRATFKDISVFGPDGTLRCRANAANLSEIRPPRIEVEAMNSGFMFGLPERMPEGLLGVRWLSGEAGSLSATLGFDTFLYSFFSSAYRDAANVAIMLRGGHTLASFGEQRGIGVTADQLMFSKASARYPVQVSVSVPHASVAAAARQNTGLLTALAGLASALLAAFAIWQFTRPPNPVAVLKSAIERGEIRPYFQPIISTRTGRVTGCEVLARWIKPDGTVIGPDRFIPLAESSGLVCEMTERLMRDALAGLAEVLPARDDFKIAVNISPMHFLKDGFAASLEKLCAAEGLKPSTLVIELTERQNLSDFAKAASVAQALRALGVRISIDDVGTGHNGLSTLQDMPSDIIKIDKRFVDTVTENPLSANIITMLTGLARQLGRITVAEGVETPGQILAVTACGVDEVQGYHYSKPVPADAFIAWCTAYTETLNASAVRGASNRVHGAPPVRAVRKRA